MTMYGEDYYDSYHDSTNGLVEHYRLENSRSGHELDCAYGAGADCNCHLSRVRVFHVKILFGGQWRNFFVGTDAAEANRVVDSLTEYPKSRRSYKSYVLSWDDYQDLQESCMAFRDKLDDWNSD